MEDRLALIEVLDRDGGVRERLPVKAWPVRIGRALDCDLVLDDPHVAGHHADIGPDETGRLSVTAADTDNGVWLGAWRLGRGDAGPLPGSGLLRLGQTRLRLRRPGEPLAPERPLPRARSRQLRTALVLGALTLALSGLEHWLRLDPSEKLSGLVPTLIGLETAIVAWSLSWGLASKLFQGHFQFLPHFNTTLRCILAVQALEQLLPGLAFAFSWAWPARILDWAQIACFAWLAASLLQSVLPARRRVVGWAVAGIYLASLSIDAGLTWQQKDRLFDYLYTSAIGPPGLRLARPVAPAQFIEELRALQAPLDRHAAEDAGEGEAQAASLED